MVSELKKGDKVITASGFLAVVTKATEGDRFIEIEIAKDVEVKVLRSSVTEMADKPQVTKVTKVSKKGEKK